MLDHCLTRTGDCRRIGHKARGVRHSILALLLIPSLAHAQPVKVFIVAGQSNAAGYGNRLQLAPVPAWAQTAANGWTGAPQASSDTGIQYQHPTVANFPMRYISHNSGLLSAVYSAWGRYEGEKPVGASTFAEEGTYGPELSFLRLYQDQHPNDAIACIKVVLGGTSIDEWLPGTNQWAILKAHLDQAKARFSADSLAYEWSGAIWHQGENGAASVWPYLHPTPGSEFSDKTRTFLQALRSQTSPTMPVVICRIGNHMLAPNIIGTASNGIDTPQNRLAATEYRRKQQALVASEPRSVLCNTDDLPVLQTGDPQWWYHHTGPGYLAMGERAYVAWQRAAGETPPPPPPPLLLTVKRNGILEPVTGGTVKLNGQVIGGPGDVIEVEYEVGP